MDQNDYQLKRDSSKSISQTQKSDVKDEKSKNILEIIKKKRESFENNYDLPLGYYKKKDE